MSIDHETLVGQATRGEPVAIDELLIQHQSRLVAYLRLHAGPLVRGKESCTDLAQSVCREVLEEMDRFEYRGEAPFRKWLFQKALNKIHSRQRRYLADKRSPLHEEGIGDLDLAGLQSIYSPVCSPTQAAIGKEELERFEATMDQLPEDYRQVITLSHIVGMSHAEIAEEMGRNEGAARSLLHRALTRLGWLIRQNKDDSTP